MRYAVVIPAAGSGSRMGARMPKVLLPWAGEQSARSESILQQTVSVFATDDSCERIIVCVPEGWFERFYSQVGEFPRVRLVIGGDSRQASVRNGVEALAEEYADRDSDIAVLVHDAARCCLRRDVVARVVQGVARYGAVTAAVPVVDAVCRSEQDVVQQYVDRSALWTVQTPQGFLLNDLVTAHRKAQQERHEGLDDAVLVAQLRPVHIVEGDRLNIKVTQPGDLTVARVVLSNQG